MLTWVTAILPLLVVLFLCWLFKGEKKKPAQVALKPSPKEESIPLEELSQVWTGEDKERVIRLEDLSKNWRTKPLVKESEPEHEKPVYSHPDIGEFHHTWVDGKPNMTGDVLLCVEELLKLLDREGDCPSVVNRNNNEVEAKLEEDVYTLLANLPLYRHSLNVAKELASRCSQKLLAPMALITGLAHDLGKLPSYQGLFYKTGDHPFIAPTILENIDSFKKLNYALDVMEAIRQHHRPQPETDLGKRLKNADQVCRNHEITLLLKKHTTSTQAEGSPSGQVTGVGTADQITDSGGKTELPSLPPKQSATSGKTRDKGADRNVAEAQIAVFGGYPDQDPDIFGVTAGKEGKIENSLIPIEWFDPGAALLYLKQFINRIKGGRFFAFSMPDGIVYVQVSYFWQMTKRLSHNDSRLLAADADIQARRDIMFSMVEKLKEKKAIATDLLGPGFFMAVFVINPGSEEPREESLIPFRAEAFGEPVSILEARKVHRLKEIKQVTAKHLLERKESIFG